MPVFFAAANETATLSTTFAVNGTLTDPGTVTLIVTDPLGVSTTYTFAGGTVTKASTGSYWREVATPTAGTWAYQWIGTTPVADIDAGTFDVFGTDLGHLYATPGQMKSRLGIPASDTASDAELQQACRAASRALEQYTRRIFWRGAAETRIVEATSRTEVRFGAFNDLVSLTGVATDLDSDGVFETTWLGADWQLYPYNAASGPEPQPYTGLVSLGSKYFPWPVVTRRGLVQITGVFGWPQVPAAISEAARILAAEIFRTKDAPLGVASFGEAGVARVRRNPLVEDLAAPYRHSDAWVVA